MMSGALAESLCSSSLDGQSYKDKYTCSHTFMNHECIYIYIYIHMKVHLLPYTIKKLMD